MPKDNRQRLFEMMFGVAKMPVSKDNVVHLTKEQFLNSLPTGEQSLYEKIDFEKEFGDVSHQCLRPDAIVKWLNEELERLRFNREKGRKEKDKIPAKKRDIIMAQGNIEALVDKSGDINLDMFITNIITEPSTIFDHNSKMEHSDIGRPQMTINTGLPALVAIVYDINEEIAPEQRFHSISTCPYAGDCTIGCYARDAFYRMNEDLIMKLTRRINLLLNNPERYEKRIFAELMNYAIAMPEGYQLFIRWNDAGDFFTKKYLDIAKNVTKKLLDSGIDVKSYAYTKSADYVMQLDKDENFVINFSTDASKIEQEKIAQWSGGSKVKMAHKVPMNKYKTEPLKYKVKSGKTEHKVKIPQWKKFFVTKGAHYDKEKGEMPKFTEGGKEGLRDYIFNEFKDKFNIEDKNSLKYTWELPFNDEGGRKYNVIVLPSGDSDRPAQRNDVRVTFLLEH